MSTDAGTVVREDAATQSALAPQYHLVLLDDNDHTYQYVVEMLGRIFGYGRSKAYAIAALVDGMGEAVVETAAHSRVLQHQRQVHAYGPDHRIAHCLGSMSAEIREA